MGLDITSLYFLIHSVEKNSNKDAVLALGDPTLHFTHDALNKFLRSYTNDIEEFPPEYELNGENLFKHLGYKTFLVLDFYEGENVDIVWDLNNSENLPTDYLNYFDLVIDPGTPHMVFDIKSCLYCISKFTKIDGYIYHISPGNNYMDSGFYQISPSLYQDYYHENKFKLVSLSLQADKTMKEIIPYTENVYYNHKLQKRFRNNKRIKVHQIVQKKFDLENKVPILNYYSTNKSESNFSREYGKKVFLKESSVKKIAKKIYLFVFRK